MQICDPALLVGHPPTPGRPTALVNGGIEKLSSDYLIINYQNATAKNKNSKSASETALHTQTDFARIVIFIYNFL